MSKHVVDGKRVEDMLVKELQAELKRRGAPSTGRKADLAKRLTELMDRDDAPQEPQPQEQEAGNEGGESARDESTNGSETQRQDNGEAGDAGAAKEEDAGARVTAEESQREASADAKQTEENAAVAQERQAEVTGAAASQDGRDSRAADDEEEEEMEEEREPRKRKLEEQEEREASEARREPRETHATTDVGTAREADGVQQAAKRQRREEDGQREIAADDVPVKERHREWERERDSEREHNRRTEPRRNSLALGDMEPRIKAVDVAPPPSGDPTTTLVIRHFVRPFTLKAVKELLSENGTITQFWMDDIKTHCYVSYENAEQAATAREAIYGLIWPAGNTNKPLLADFASPKEIEEKISSGSKSTDEKAPERGRERERSERRGDRERGEPQRREQAAAPAEPRGLTLDDLFRKTNAKPPIYYLPLSDEQVRQKEQERKEKEEKEKEERERLFRERERKRRRRARSSSRSPSSSRSRSPSSSRSRSPSSSRSRSPSSSRSRSSRSRSRSSSYSRSRSRSRGR